MQNICIIGNSSWSILNFRQELIDRLLKNHYKVTIIAPDTLYREELIAKGCNFLILNMSRLSMNPFSEIRTIYSLFKSLKQFKFDYIFSFNVKPNIYSCFAAATLRSRVIPNVSGLGSIFIGKGMPSKILKILYKVSFKFAYYVFFQNRFDREIFINNNLISKNKSSQLPGSGINLTTFQKDNIHLLDEGKIRISFVGRIIRDKGVIEFLEAAKHFANNPSIVFNLYGEFDLNNPSAISEDKFRSYLSEQIIYNGKIANIKDALRLTDCIVLPSYREGMSRSLLEAAAFGLPIIASNVPGCLEIIDDGMNGFLVQKGDHDSIIKAVKKIISIDRRELYRMGNRSRIIAESNFSVELVIKKYLSLLDDGS